MVKIVPTHPHLIADYQDEILQSLDDEDVSIRMRALELVSSMVRCVYVTFLMRHECSKS
jgi:AP-3 complex subunit delta-1